MKSLNGSAKIIWISGLICGICLSIVWLIVDRFVASNISAIGWTTNVRAGLIPFFLFIAGMLAAKRTGQLSTGMLAGIIASLSAGTIVVAFGLLILRSSPSFLEILGNLGDMRGLGVFLSLSFAAGVIFGYIGGLAGCRQYLPQD